MAYKRGRFYQIDLRPTGYAHRVGPFSTRATRRDRAEQMEATIRELAITGRHDLLDALRAANFTLPRLHTAKLTGRLHDLLQDHADPPLREDVRNFLIEHPDKQYRAAMDKLLEIATPNVRRSWLNDAENLKKLVRRYRSAGLRPGTEHRQLAGISILLRERFGEGRGTELWRSMKVRRRDKPRIEWLTTEQIRKVREAAGEWWVMIATALATGLRQGEQLALRVKDIDAQAGTLVVEGQAKGAGKSRGARRVLPLSGEVLALLRGWIAAERLEANDRVFNVAPTTLTVAWHQIREHVGLGHVRWHDLRHTYAVHCAKSGMPLPELQKRLGHATITQTMAYAEYQPPLASTHYSKALEAMGMGERATTDIPTVATEEGESVAAAAFSGAPTLRHRPCSCRLGGRRANRTR